MSDSEWLSITNILSGRFFTTKPERFVARFLKLLKRHIASQRKVPKLKHGHIRNQHTQISEKKIALNFINFIYPIVLDL